MRATILLATFFLHMTQSTKRGLWVLVARVVVALLLVLYYIFDPGSSLLAPKCPIKLVTGYDCPSCGGQRVLHNVLHGNFAVAFWINPFLWLCLPYILLILYAWLFTTPRAQKVARYVFHPYTIYLYLTLYGIWWVVRNTPLWHDFVARVA